VSAPRIEAWGTFDVANTGDLLFPLVLEHELRARGVPGALALASPIGGIVPLGVAREVRRIAAFDEPGFAAQADVAAIVLGGGDILRVRSNVAADLVPGAAGVYRYDVFLAELAALAAAVPVVINGVGVPVPFTSDAARAVRLLAARASYVAVRDEPSRRHLEDAGVDTDVAVVPDPALVVDRIIPRAVLDTAVAELRARGAYPATGPVLAFHVSFTSDADDDALGRALRRVVSDRPDVKIALVPIGPCHGDVERMARLAGMIGPLATAVDGDATLVELVAAIAGADAFIGSSLHGNVVAARYGVPGAFLKLPAHRPHKLDAASDLLGRSELDVDEPARVVHVAHALLDGALPVDERRLDRLARAVDDHYDRIVSALRPAPGPARASTRVAVGPRVRILPAATSGPTVHGGCILDVDRIRAAVLGDTPFRWGVVDGLYDAPDRQALVDTYPVEPFATIEGYDGEKGYVYEARCLVAMGGAAPWRPDLLSEAWLRLATDFCSREYRAAMSAITGLDLDGLVMEANLFHYGPGAWLGSHVDLPAKVVTHVLYFNDDWDPHLGGCLQVLRDGGAEVVHEVPPAAGSSVVLVRSDTSWHAVARVADDCHDTRRSVTVTFCTPGSVSTMWPPGTERPLHRYPPAELLAGAAR
jgi:hypothetical protein